MSEREQWRRNGGESVPTGRAQPDVEPEIRRPRGVVWRRLEAEGLVWEGQVLLLGDEVDLAARMIVTKRRVAFIRGGAVALEVGREWLKPPPLLLEDGTIVLSIVLPGSAPEEFFVQTREGRRVAGHLVTLLGGSGVRRVRPADPPKPAPAPSRASTPRAQPPMPPPSRERPPALPGPLFPDEIGTERSRANGAGAFFERPDVRPDPAPPSPYEPSWARPRHERDWRSGARDLLGERDDRYRLPERTGRDESTMWSEPVARGEWAERGERWSWEDRPEPVPALAPAASLPESSRPRENGWSSIDLSPAPLAPSLLAGDPDDGEPAQRVPAIAAPTGVGRNHDWNLQPIPGMAPRAARKRRRQEWLARLLGLLILIVFAAVTINSATPIDLPGSDRDDGNRLAAPTGTTQQPMLGQAAPTWTPTPTVAPPAPGTSVVDLAAAQTAEAIGVGGAGTVTDEATHSPTAVPTSAVPTQPAATDVATATTTPEGALSLAEANFPTNPRPTAERTATSAATSTPTTEPTAPPTQAPTPKPTATATETPTPPPTEPPTVTPSIVPDEESVATDEEAAAEEDAAPSGPTPVPPSLAMGEVPAQVFVSGPFRFQIVGGVRAPSVPDLELYDYGTGDWVALFVDVLNWSSYPAPLRMADFTLSDPSRTAPVLLDTGTALIARGAGLEAAYVHDAEVPYAAGEQHRILLLFLVHPDATDLKLRTSEAAVELDDILGETFSLADLPAEESIMPELVQGFVTYVYDAETIDVDISGTVQQVRYLGIEPPAPGACWNMESVQTNINLVVGQLVWLERQRSNADGDGRWLRDVWVVGPDGALDLVAERLVVYGAVDPAPSSPNTRLSEWLLGMGDDAALVGAGKWSYCPVAGGDGLGLGQGLAALLPFLAGLVWLAAGTPGLDALVQRRSSGSAASSSDRRD